MKAKYIGRYCDWYGKYTDLEYEYKGHSYFVRIHSSGNASDEALHLQHKREQRRIDEMLETPATEPEEYTGECEKAFDLFWEYVEK